MTIGVLPLEIKGDPPSAVSSAGGDTGVALEPAGTPSVSFDTLSDPACDESATGAALVSTLPAFAGGVCVSD